MNEQMNAHLVECKYERVNENMNKSGIYLTMHEWTMNEWTMNEWTMNEWTMNEWTMNEWTMNNELWM